MLTGANIFKIFGFKIGLYLITEVQRQKKLSTFKNTQKNRL